MLCFFFRCGHCSIFYDAIFKLENIESDFKLLSEVLNLPPRIKENLISVNWRSKEEQEKIEKRRRDYFEELSERQMEALKRVYIKDFQLFNYSMKGYGRFQKDDHLRL